MGFKQATPNEQRRDLEAYVSIYTNGNARFSKGARQQYLDGYDYVHLYVDREYSRLAFEPVRDDAENAYTLGRKATVTTASTLGSIGIDPADIDVGYRLDVKEDDETGYLVVDLTELVNQYSDDVACEECGRRCKNEQGLRTHRSKKHGRNARVREALEETDPSEIGEEVPEGDNSYKDLAEASTTGGGGQ